MTDDAIVAPPAMEFRDRTALAAAATTDAAAAATPAASASEEAAAVAEEPTFVFNMCK